LYDFTHRRHAGATAYIAFATAVGRHLRRGYTALVELSPANRTPMVNQYRELEATQGHPSLARIHTLNR
jgi:hypothetical protein